MPRPKKIRVVYGVIVNPLLGESEGKETIFGLRDEAQRLVALREALRVATTWGDLRARVDAGSFEEAMNHCNVFYETYEEFCGMGGLEPGSGLARTEFEALAVGQRKPLDGDPFERAQIRALLDGDWPHTLDGQTDDWMPKVLLAKYATFDASMGGGAGHSFDPKDRGKIARELRPFGFTVVRDDDLVLQAQYDVF